MQDNNKQNPKQEAFPPANIGNASNPAPDDDSTGRGSQLIDKRGEKYLHEVASPEDYPDAEDQQEADKIIEKEKDDDSKGQ